MAVLIHVHVAASAAGAAARDGALVIAPRTGTLTAGARAAIEGALHALGEGVEL